MALPEWAKIRPHVRANLSKRSDDELRFALNRWKLEFGTAPHQAEMVALLEEMLDERQPLLGERRRLQG